MALTQVTKEGLKDAEIENADISASAAIAISKLATDTTNAANISSGFLPDQRISDASIVEGKLDIHQAPSDGKFLKFTSANGMEWGDVPAGVGGATGVTFNDDVKGIWGTSGDGLEIFHGSSQSWIKDVGTGNLIIDTDGTQVSITSGGGAKTAARFVKDDAVKLSFNDSIKFETTNLGAKVVGDLQMGGTAGVKFSHAGTTSIYESQTAGDSLLFKTTPSGGSTTERLRLDSDGNCGLGLTPQCTTGKILNLNDEYFIGFGNGGNGRPDFQIGTTGGAQLDIRCGFGSDTVDAYITSSGYLVVNENVGIGTSSSNAKLVINSGASANAVSVRNTTGGNGTVGILFSTQDHSGGREKAAIFHHETHGQAHFGGDLVVCLNGSTGGATQVSLSDRRATFKKDGGLCFNADSAYDNALDDYEEGTFTPKMGGSNYGTYSITGTGKYTKIGRTVHIEFKFTNQNLDDNASGQMRIRDWPFSINTTDSRPQCSALMMHNVGLPTAGDNNTYIIYGDTLSMYGLYAQDNAAWDSWMIGNFLSSSMYFEGTFTHMV